MPGKSTRKRSGGVCLRPDGRLVARIMIDGKRYANYVQTEEEGYAWIAEMRDLPDFYAPRRKKLSLLKQKIKVLEELRRTK